MSEVFSVASPTEFWIIIRVLAYLIIMNIDLELIYKVKNLMKILKLTKESKIEILMDSN